MLKVVFDTNVIVSAMLHKQGVPALLVKLALSRKIHPVYSPHLMLEYDEVLRRKKFRLPKKDVDEILGDLRNVGIEVFPTQTITLITKDPQDNRILEASLEAKADYIITGNRKHFPFAKFKKTRIVTPREFLESEGAYLR